MPEVELVVLDPIKMKHHPELSERWLQTAIADNPSMLGFGKLEVRQVEHPQPNGGRLDLLLSDQDNSTRYEVELQLGPVDPDHIVRTLEYWDNERRRLPQYKHVAVIVAEEIQTRFFNVIGLFNGSVPIVAIQVTALTVDENRVALVFARVLDHAVLASEEEDPGTDRPYWENKSTKQIMALVDRIRSMVVELDPGIELKYNKHTIGLARNGVADNYVSMVPQKKKMNLGFRIKSSGYVSDKIAESGIGTMPPEGPLEYKVVIPSEAVIEHHAELLAELIGIAKAGGV